MYNQTALPSVSVMREFAVPRSVLTYLLSTAPTIHPLFQDLLSYYRLHYWQNSYILSQSQNGIIRKDNIDFHVVYRKPRGKLLADPYGQTSLSFRAAIPEYKILPYVIVS